MASALKLVVFDATQLGRKPPGLGLSWRLGSTLYRGFGGVDGSFGARSWEGALAWLASYRPRLPIAEIQYWGHGKWGRAVIDAEPLDRSALGPAHRLRAPLEAVRARLAPGALVWFRTCETLGARAGQDFACALSDFLGATVAGHTFEIAFFQSGLRALRPGMAPGWSAEEGLASGSAEAPVRAHPSHPREPSTITCLTTQIPEPLLRGGPGDLLA